MSRSNNEDDEDSDDSPRIHRRWRWIAAVVLLFTIGGLVWAMRPDPHMAMAKKLQNELFGEQAKNLPSEERKAKFEAFRTEMKHLDDKQKAVLFAPSREKEKAELDRYFAMSPQEKVKHLDEQITRSDAMKKKYEERRKTSGTADKGRPPGSPGFGSRGPGGPSGNGGPTSTASYEHRRKERLDLNTPEERAQRDAYRRDMDTRRKQLGLTVRQR